MVRALPPSELENFPSLNWTEIAPRLTPEIRSALETVLTTLDGTSLTRDQALQLANCDGDDPSRPDTGNVLQNGLYVSGIVVRAADLHDIF